MKKTYSKPQFHIQLFVPNAYMAACGGVNRITLQGKNGPITGFIWDDNLTDNTETAYYGKNVSNPDESWETYIIESLSNPMTIIMGNARLYTDKEMTEELNLTTDDGFIWSGDNSDSASDPNHCCDVRQIPGVDVINAQIWSEHYHLMSVANVS